MQLALGGAAALRLAAAMGGDMEASGEDGTLVESWFEELLEFRELGSETLAKSGKGVSCHTWNYLTSSSQDQAEKPALG